MYILVPASICAFKLALKVTVLLASSLEEIVVPDVIWVPSLTSKRIPVRILVISVLAARLTRVPLELLVAWATTSETRAPDNS